MLGPFGRLKNYRVLIKGHNVLLRDVGSGKMERLGFFTTRFVKAPDQASARERAKALVAEAVAAIEPLNDPSDGPTLEVEEIQETKRLDEVEGFTFFAEN
jgi:hypothetical protein